jgi:hypothetical protein
MNRRHFLRGGGFCAGAAAIERVSARQASSLGDPSPFSGSPLQREEINLRDAIVVIRPGELPPAEETAATVLIEEVEKRTRIRLQQSTYWPQGKTVIAISSTDAVPGWNRAIPPREGMDRPEKQPEGFRLVADTRGQTPGVWIVGADPRGSLFGVGQLLRRLDWSEGKLSIAAHLDIATAPAFAIRGHQLGYRAQANSYDAWSATQFEQYIRELTFFGANSIEGIPFQDDRPTPVMTFPRRDMNRAIGEICQRYGLDYWAWIPVDFDLTDQSQRTQLLKRCGEFFRDTPEFTGFFYPGGDPGNNPPELFLPFLEDVARILTATHPKAKIWLSVQQFRPEKVDYVYNYIERQSPPWLRGLVAGPSSPPLEQLRARLPQPYRLRDYPDLTHNKLSQYEVPEWDQAYALTEGREVINPRPMGEANISRLQAPRSIGFITYAEGCNDDVNKIVWSALGWDPVLPVVDILREYSAYLVSDRLADSFAQGLLSLEENWQGPLLTNQSVYPTLEQFQSMENSATPAELENWRFQMGLYRAYYDAYIRRRLINEIGAENRALNRLAEIRRTGVRPNQMEVESPDAAVTSSLDPTVLLNLAAAELDAPLQNPVSPEWRTRLLELGEALFQSIHMQLAVERYQAEAVERAANLDTLDSALTDGPWLKECFGDIRRLPSHAEKIRAIEALLDRSNPGPGGFYDDLGNLTCQPHLVRGLGPTRDPEFKAPSLVGFGYPDWCPDVAPLAWKRWAESLFDAPLEMHYPHLYPLAQYRVRVTYSGETPERKIRLEADGKIEVHPFITKPNPVRSLEFDIPTAATSRGELTLRWFREPGLGGNGRSCQVAEVWLMKK